jgi:hypothetical protein
MRLCRRVLRCRPKQHQPRITRKAHDPPWCPRRMRHEPLICALQQCGAMVCGGDLPRLPGRHPRSPHFGSPTLVAELIEHTGGRVCATGTMSRPAAAPEVAPCFRGLGYHEVAQPDDVKETLRFTKGRPCWEGVFGRTDQMYPKRVWAENHRWTRGVRRAQSSRNGGRISRSWNANPPKPEAYSQLACKLTTNCGG